MKRFTARSERQETGATSFRLPASLPRLRSGYSAPTQRDGGPPGYLKTDVRYWMRQLVYSLHGSLARPCPFRELSVRIEHDGQSSYFPLGTDERKPAADRALEIYRTVRFEGWSAAFERYPREITLAVFWREDPMVFTYTTLYTAPNPDSPYGPGDAAKTSRRRRVTVAVVEPDRECAAAIRQWLEGLPHYCCAEVFPTFEPASARLKPGVVDLVLFNRQGTGSAPFQVAPAGAAWASAGLRLGYGIYPTSDDLFVSQPVVSGGYYFRRRPPNELLDPVRGAWGQRPPSVNDWEGLISAYLRERFLSAGGRDGLSGRPALTSREQEILVCLRKGFTDKEIAGWLDISAWTVHAHLKKIYEKLGVHSRTEAVFHWWQS